MACFRHGLCRSPIHHQNLNQFCRTVWRFFTEGQEVSLKDITRKLTNAGLTASSIGLLLQITTLAMQAQPNDAALIAKAKLIHSRVLKLDTHNDIDPSNFTADCNYTKCLPLK